MAAMIHVATARPLRVVHFMTIYLWANALDISNQPSAISHQPLPMRLMAES
jgi:hypothetical protein